MMNDFAISYINLKKLPHKFQKIKNQDHQLSPYLMDFHLFFAKLTINDDKFCEIDKS